MKSILFKSPYKVIVKNTETSMDEEKTIIENSCSIISPGTELAILKGTESWAPLPYEPGYGSVGTVVNMGVDFPVTEGTTVFTYGHHREMTQAETVCIPVPFNLQPEAAVFARMAAVSMTAIRCSDIILGDKVLVTGAGLVGNLAAQLAEASGAQVFITDPSEQRRRLAEKCGISYALDPEDHLEEQIMDLTGGDKCSTFIEATGQASIAESGLKLTGDLGEMILLGSPRTPYNTNLTEFLNKSHLFPGCITIKGAHEWRYPILKDSLNRYRFSIEKNIEDIFLLMRKGILKTDPLLTHYVKPEEAQKVYMGLKDDKDNYLGIVFNWKGAKK